MRLSPPLAVPVSAPASSPASEPTSARRRRVALAVAATALVPLGSLAAPTADAATPAASTPRSFSCTHQLAPGRAYTKQTVTGTLTGTVPTGVSVIDYQGTVIRSAPKPSLDNRWWNGYYTTQQLNQWDLGQNTSAHYHLMLPQVAPGATFTAVLVSEFLVGGNWQNTMPCTAS